MANEGSQGAESTLAQRLKSVRTKAGLSQRELARRADMTNGALSNIEQGKVSPTVSSLEKILSAIPMSLPEFFSDEQDLAPSIYRGDSFARVNQNDTEYLMMPIGEVTQSTVYLSQQTFAPGARVSSEWMVHKGQVAGIIVSGQLTLTLDSIEHELHSGEGFHFSIHRPHIFKNSASEPCVVVSVSISR